MLASTVSPELPSNQLPIPNVLFSRFRRSRSGVDLPHLAHFEVNNTVLRRDVRKFLQSVASSPPAMVRWLSLHREKDVSVDHIYYEIETLIGGHS